MLFHTIQKRSGSVDVFSRCLQDRLTISFWISLMFIWNLSTACLLLFHFTKNILNWSHLDTIWTKLLKLKWKGKYCNIIGRGMTCIGFFLLQSWLCLGLLSYDRTFSVHFHHIVWIMTTQVCPFIYLLDASTF